MKEEDKYYIPSIDEFKQGFKYEQLVRKKGDYIGKFHVGFDEGEEIYVEKDWWMEKEVWWDREPKIQTLVVDDEGTTFSWMEDPEFDNWPTKEQIQKLIDDGKIRARK